MPSPIGHALAGAAIAASAGRFSKPTASNRALRATLALTCAVLAALPDLDLVYAPIHRTVTHSVGATLLVTIIAMGVTGRVMSGISSRTALWLALICGAAYGSHVLLDWLARDPYPPLGIQALWPFSDRWFTSGWNIFRPTERRALFSWAAIATNVKAVAQEVAILGPLLWLAMRTRRTRAPISVRDDQP